MANTGIATALLTYMSDEKNRPVTIDEMVDFFDGDFTRRQIMSNMANLLQTPVGQQYITRIQMGVWKYEDSSKDEDRISFTVLKYDDSGNGDALLLGDNKDVYRLTRLG